MRRTLPVLLAALLLPLGPAAGAAPACGPGAVEVVASEGAVLQAGGEHVQAFVVRRLSPTGAACVAPGVTVELLARTKNDTATPVVRTATTDPDGRVEFRVRPPYTTVLTGRSVATAELDSATSPSVVVRVQTRLTLSTRALAGCRTEVAGRSHPAKPGSRVTLTTARGTSIGSVGIASDGTYGGVLSRPCDDPTALRGSVPETARNEAGSSGRPPAADPTPGTCGTGPSGQGPAGLVQRFEPINLTTVVGGAWTGERVVENTGEAPVTFSSGRMFSTSEPYRLMRSGTTALLGKEGWTDAGEGATARTLQPGEQWRTRVVLAALNCYAPPPSGYAVLESTPGPPLPAGTVVGVTVLKLGDGTEWASQRVALRIV